MRGLGRYVSLFGLQLRTSGLLAAQYRWDFLIDGALSVFSAAAALVPLFVVYADERRGIPGWSFEESLVVIGCFLLLQAILEGAINPGLVAVIEHIRKGTLDFVLLKPADAQFLVSTSRFQLWRVAGLVNASIVFTFAFTRLGRWPSAVGVLQMAVLVAAAVWILYSLWIVIVSAAFYVVKIDNLTYLFTSLFDLARWPVTVFRGALRVVFTVLLPLGLMTTYPAEALLGRLDWPTLVASVLGAGLFAAAARAVWLRSIRHYTSAGG